MTFHERYSTVPEKDKDGKDKKVISNDAYAVGEMIDELKDFLRSLKNG